MGPYVLTALRARELYKRDIDYIVRDGEVKIVSSSTGRVLPSSRWTDDVHQVQLSLHGLTLMLKPCMQSCAHKAGIPTCARMNDRDELSSHRP
jgi:hypothetical protein